MRTPGDLIIGVKGVGSPGLSAFEATGNVHEGNPGNYSGV